MIDMQNTGFNFPQQWGWASDILKMFAEGMPTGIPDIWNQLGGYLGDVWGKGGMATDTSDWWKSRQAQIEPDITKRIQQATEQAGLHGLRYSTPLGQQAARIGSEEATRAGTEYARMGMGAQESALGRMMQTLPMMLQLGGGMAGLGESAKDRALQATGQLGQLGQMYANLPMNVANLMAGIGGQQQQANMAGFSPYLQQWQYGLPQNNPWLGMGMNFPYGGFGQMPQMYNPSFLTQMLGAGASVAPWLMGG